MKPFVLAALLLAPLALADLPAPEAAPAAVVEPAPAPAPALKHPEGIEKAMGSGVIEGGWEYIYAAYGVGLLGVLVFAASLFIRRPKGLPERAP
ncbi:MAG: hypothetical protein IAE78_29445 [Myxococcus sp.]|nr:hypothetical protein [Myxococcus sp.]